MERNGLDEQSAAKRIDAQSSNQDKVDRANVVICTLWEYEYTGQQVRDLDYLLYTSTLCTRVSRALCGKLISLSFSKAFL